MFHSGAQAHMELRRWEEMRWRRGFFHPTLDVEFTTIDFGYEAMNVRLDHGAIKTSNRVVVTLYARACALRTSNLKSRGHTSGLNLYIFRYLCIASYCVDRLALRGDLST